MLDSQKEDIERLLFEEERFEECEKELRRILEVEPSNAWAHKYLGYALAYIGRETESEEEFDIAVKLYKEKINKNPEDLESRENLMEIYEKVVELYPSEENCLELVKFYGLGERLEKHLEVWRRCLNKNPDSELAIKNLRKLSIANRYEDYILKLVEKLKNVNFGEANIFFCDKKITVQDITNCSERYRIWDDEAKSIKTFLCTIEDISCKIYISYAIRPSQGYMIYSSIDYPQLAKLEFNLTKMLKNSKDDQLKFVYNITYALQDGKEKNIERKNKSLELCEQNGINIIDDKIYLGTYSFKEEEFSDTTFDDFVKNIIILTIIKGHFSGNFEISGLPRISGTEAFKKPSRIKPSSLELVEISDDKLLIILKNKIRDIRAYINGNLNVEVSDEKLCFWVWLCYELGLYREGAKIFRRIDERAVSPDFYRIVNKLGIACELKAGSH